MALKSRYILDKVFFLVLTIICCLFANNVSAQNDRATISGNYGLPGIIDLPTALRFPDGELNFTQQAHKSLSRSGISFQALPRLSFSFKYSGHGVGGYEAYGRVNHDRSFDAHLSIFDEKNYRPALAIGLRDFIGTGWYSSEYLVATKTFGNLELTAGLGFGRLNGRGSLSNPLSVVSKKFEKRDLKNFGKGGTLANINWFRGNASPFYGINYRLGEKIIFSSEYTPDLMALESSYLKVQSPWNHGLKYKLNNYLNLNLEYLHGSQFSLTANIPINPDRPPMVGGKELAPVPMRARKSQPRYIKQTNEELIRKVLSADNFIIHNINFEGNSIRIDVTNTKFRSTSQALGRVASTLQRFTSDDIKVADIAFISKGLQVASYRFDLTRLAEQQFNPQSLYEQNQSINALDLRRLQHKEIKSKLSWGLGPYVTQRLFNPDLPFSIETGVEFSSDYRITSGLKLSGSVRKSILTNLTDNHRRSNSKLPHVHSDWPLYDFAGQNGHIDDLTISYTSNLAPGFYGKIYAGLLEPFYAGVGGELLYKPAKSPVAIGFDIHRVQQRDYDMLFDLRDYKTTVGHFNFYYDAGKMFNIQINAGRYLAGDWGATTTISRKFGSGWEVGGYATLTDVPFDVFGEGSFDKAIYVKIPLDWIVSTPNKTRRNFILRPITRDGGASLMRPRSLYFEIESSQNASVQREYGRIWK